MAVSSRLLLLALFALVACAQQPTRTWDIPADAKFVRVNDYDMTYLERGSGPPLLLVHGALTDYRFFAGSIDILARQHRVLSVGLRHYYPEAWDGRGTTFTGTQHASDIAALIRALGLGRVHLFGHSRGAGVVLLVAKNSPEVLRSLIVSEGGGGFRALNPRAPLPGQTPGPVTPLVATTQALLDQGRRDEAAMTYWNGVGGPGAWDKESEMDKEFLKANIWTVRPNFDSSRAHCPGSGASGFRKWLICRASRLSSAAKCLDTWIALEPLLFRGDAAYAWAHVPA